MKPMTYKGYIAQIEYSDEDASLVGRVMGTPDLITFHGESVQEIRSAFQEAIDFYVQTCLERGEEAHQPYSGKLMLQLSPDIHAAMASSAATSGKSIDEWAADVLRSAALQISPQPRVGR